MCLFRIMFRLSNRISIIQVREKMAEDPKRKISRVLRCLFILILLISGFDFGFTEIFNRKFRFLIKSFSFLLGIICAMILVYASFKSFEAPQFMVTAWVCAMCIQFILYFIVLKIAKYSFYDFVNNLSKIDGISGSVESDAVAAVSFLYTFGLVTSKLIYNCKIDDEASCNMFGVPFNIFFFTLFAEDVVALELILVYYYLYRSIKRLVEKYENSEINLESLQQRYIDVANCLDGISPHYDLVLFIELLIDLPKMLGILWLTLVYIKENAKWTVYVGEYFYAFHIMIQIFIPALMADRLNVQVESLKLLLHKQLIKPEDENSDVLRLLQYIEARSLSHKLCRIIPVDLRLPVSLFSLCTTYFIVIIQFTHLYD